MNQKSSFIGIDVAKARLDVAIRPTDKQWQVNYTEEGIQALVEQITKLHPALVLFKASGGLELPIVAALAVANMLVVVVNPKQVGNFAKATGKLVKTDSLFAYVLDHFAESIRPLLRSLLNRETQALNALVTRRNQVMGMLVTEKIGCAHPDRR